MTFCEFHLRLMKNDSCELLLRRWRRCVRRLVRTVTRWSWRWRWALPRSSRHSWSRHSAARPRSRWTSSAPLAAPGVSSRSTRVSTYSYLYLLVEVSPSRPLGSCWETLLMDEDSLLLTNRWIFFSSSQGYPAPVLHTSIHNFVPWCQLVTVFLDLP